MYVRNSQARTPHNHLLLLSSFYVQLPTLRGRQIESCVCFMVRPAMGRVGSMGLRRCNCNTYTRTGNLCLFNLRFTVWIARHCRSHHHHHTAPHTCSHSELEPIIGLITGESKHLHSLMGYRQAGWLSISVDRSLVVGG
ncbi:hypothetical protein P167DRAFT_341648 [Morchella conica CCBAS932]|uniref:Uncharacterized protein n=1 Tax=Morchella conica CCBAS932 TaxID=1392247 RepID=A0A3N4KRY3_9PEZI|nr:hypothetical protein P167DRAFT_341648 [Morchella conica CCBAS932]